MRKHTGQYRFIGLAFSTTLLSVLLLRAISGSPGTSHLQSQAVNDPGLAPEFSEELSCLVCRYQDYEECNVPPVDCGNVIVNGMNQCQVFDGSCVSWFRVECERIAQQFQHTNTKTQVLTIPMTDPLESYDLSACTSLKIVDEKHGDPIDRFCIDDVIPIKACLDVAPSCTQFTYLHNGCSTFRNIEPIREWAQNLFGSEGLDPSVSITVGGNQTVVGSNGCNESLVTVHISCDDVRVEYPKCHEASEACHIWTGGSKNTAIKCEGSDGVVRREICCANAQGTAGEYVPGSHCPTYGQCNGVGSAYTCSQATSNAQQNAERCLQDAMTACETKGWSFTQETCNTYTRNNSVFGSCTVEHQCAWSCVDDAGIAGGTGGGGSW